MECPLDWTVAIKEIGDRDKHFTRRATDAERAALAAALNLLSCDELAAEFTIRPRALGCYRLQGSMRAHLIQACIVSLEPVPADLEEDFDVEYRPAELVEQAPPATDRAVLDGRDVEPIDGNRLDAGRIIFEHFSAALDPYPRKEGAEFHWEEKVDANVSGEPINPFAVLKSLALGPGKKGKKK